MLPYLSEVQNASKKYTVAFRGLNYGEGTQDGEFSETHNLSTDLYPCITQRAKRIKVKDYEEPTTLHSKGNLLVIDGTDVLYGDNKVGEVTLGKKQTATIGNYIVIFPDKKYYQVPTENDQDGTFGSMEEEYKATGLKFTESTITIKKAITASMVDFTASSITLATDYKASGLIFKTYKIETLENNFPFKDGDVVSISGSNKSGYNHTDLTILTATPSELTFEANTFPAQWNCSYDITISRAVKDKLCFAEGETITISGCSVSENNKEAVIKAATDTTLTFEDGTFTEARENGDITIAKKGGSFPFREGDAVTITGCSNSGNNKTTEIVIRGKTDYELTFDDNAFTAVENEANEVTIARTVPDLDFICESNYRLWGTHGNTIYSSKFSDPFNFKVFDNLATDSYAIEVGSEGEFTGCIPYSSHICFFKENTLHKLYGTKPSNFQITTVNVYGVQSGSEKSMQIVNEQLLYKGVGGVYAYTGGVPRRSQ